jgi:NAD(P)-dependent dehydrogenase (short-subunit alcohol dehydrogenase family)
VTVPPEARPRIALVTGAGSGIGRSSSVALASSGFTVVAAGRRPDAIEETARRCHETGTDGLAVPTDVRRTESVSALFETIRSTYGRVDVVFNNAGRNAPQQPFEDLPLSVWLDVVETNLTGTFLVTQEAFRLMKTQEPQGGRIINNGSISAQVPRPLSAPYTATKHAITGLTKSTSLDGRPYRIACSQIDIGNAATDMADSMGSEMLQADGSQRSEPLMDVDDVARLVVLMAELPLDANIQSATILATTMPYVGRG